MNEQLTRVSLQFIADRNAIKKTFPLGNAYVIAMCAMAFGSRKSVVSSEKLEECQKHLEQNTSFFSNFRGHVMLPTITILAAAENPLDTLQNAMAIYSTMKEHFYGSQYLAYISAFLTEMTTRDRAEEIAVRAKTIYDRMRKEHPLLTSGEDSVFAVLMAFSDKSDDALINDTEESYTILKKRFFNSNAVQTVSHVLALTAGAVKDKCDRFLALYDALEMAGKKYSKSYELSVLATVSMLDVDIDTLVAEISQADDFLKGQKGYGFFSIPGTTRLMHAAMLVSNLYQTGKTADTAAMTGTLAMIAAQQAAMCAVIASTTAATAAN